LIHHILRILLFCITNLLLIKKETLTNREIGDIGESLAAKHLSLDNYQILETNWRYSKAEIDIIAKRDDILVFIEVKTRSYDYYGKPEEAVTPKQEHLIMDAAQRYMEEVGHEWEIRFDIISIILDKNKSLSKLEHFKDAFFA